jgi:hypothetical protein
MLADVHQNRPYWQLQERWTGSANILRADCEINNRSIEKWNQSPEGVSIPHLCVHNEKRVCLHLSGNVNFRNKLRSLDKHDYYCSIWTEGTEGTAEDTGTRPLARRGESEVQSLSGSQVIQSPSCPTRGAGIAQSVKRHAPGRTIRGSNPSWARFPAPVQTGSGAHPASYTMGTGSFPGVKRPERSVDHPFPSSACTGLNFIFTFILSYSALSITVLVTAVKLYGRSDQEPSLQANVLSQLVVSVHVM